MRSKMEERKEKNENGGNEYTRRKRQKGPAHVCLFCEEKHVPVCLFCKEKHEPLRTKSVESKRLAKSVTIRQELLPGIVDDVALEWIIPKLSWRDVYVLRSVSRTWQQAIQSHVVYESRVRAQSTDTLVIVAQYNVPTCESIELSMYSSKEDIWVGLPPNPYLREGFPQQGQCVWLDGKLYVMGGIKDSVTREDFDSIFKRESAKVYMLDLAGQRQCWQECADMHEPRQKFSCGVVDGKIYVFGGKSHLREYLCESEVYDPKVNTWSRIQPMMYPRAGHFVFKLGHELFVHGGSHQDDDGSLFCTKKAFGLEAYDPVKNEWRFVTQSFGVSLSDGPWLKLETHKHETIFTAEGKVHVMSLSRESGGIALYDFDKQTWAPWKQCNPILVERPIEDLNWDVLPSYNIVVDHELLGLSALRQSDCNLGHVYDSRLIRSRGFGNEKGDIVWEHFARSRCPNLGRPLSMWAIQI